jgi:hypothetical protein
VVDVLTSTGGSGHHPEPSSFPVPVTVLARHGDDLLLVGGFSLLCRRYAESSSDRANTPRELPSIG